MAVREQAYEFVSRWEIPAPRETCWDQLSDPGTWSTWWPHLTSSVVRRGDADGVGTRGALTYRSPLGYRLRIGIEVVATIPPRDVTFAVVGDLRGRARAELEEIVRDGAAWTRVTTYWPVRTTRGWMNAVGPALRPAFAWAHTRVMADGERGFSRHVAPPVGRRH